jgi:hypothetical protein
MGQSVQLPHLVRGRREAIGASIKTAVDLFGLSKRGPLAVEPGEEAFFEGQSFLLKPLQPCILPFEPETLFLTLNKFLEGADDSGKLGASRSLFFVESEAAGLKLVVRKDAVLLLVNGAQPLATSVFVSGGPDMALR